MRCSRCGGDLTLGARFCSTCGLALTPGLNADPVESITELPQATPSPLKPPDPAAVLPKTHRVAPIAPEDSGPSVLPTIASSFFLGPFGAIWANRDAAIARTRGGDTRRYWIAFAASWCAAAVCAVLLIGLWSAHQVSNAISSASIRPITPSNASDTPSAPSKKSGGTAPGFVRSTILAEAAQKCGTEQPKILGEGSTTFETTTFHVGPGQASAGFDTLKCLVQASGRNAPYLPPDDWSGYLI